MALPLVDALMENLLFLPIKDLRSFQKNRIQFPCCPRDYHVMMELIGFFEVGGV
tara:strand:- start:729 stop:890 length:162 start_codon:yes stop_codon:yes gene_type:complete